MPENGKPIGRLGPDQPAMDKAGCDQDRSRSMRQEAPCECRCQLWFRLDLVLAERHADAPLGQLHAQRRCDRQSIFRDIHEKNVASLRRTNHGTTQYVENSGRPPLKQALVFFDHPRAKFRGRFHIFGKRDQIPRELLGIDVRLPGAVFQQEIDGVPESLRREHGTAML